MAKVDAEPEDWFNDDMWQVKPVLYDLTCKGCSNQNSRNQRAAAIADIADVFATTINTALDAVSL